MAEIDDVRAEVERLKEGIALAAVDLAAERRQQ